MNLSLNRIPEKIYQNEFIKKFIVELSEKLEKNNKIINERDIKLSEEEDWEFYLKKYNFLQEFFKKELLDFSKGEIFIVTNKYENDYKLHRYKVAQYINNHLRKYIAFEKDLPENVKVDDVVRKIDGKYFFDEEATKYVKDTIDKFKQEIINNRNY